MSPSKAASSCSSSASRTLATHCPGCVSHGPFPSHRHAAAGVTVRLSRQGRVAGTPKSRGPACPQGECASRSGPAPGPRRRCTRCCAVDHSTLLGVEAWLDGGRTLQGPLGLGTASGSDNHHRGLRRRYQVVTPRVTSLLTPRCAARQQQLPSASHFCLYLFSGDWRVSCLACK